MKLEDRLISDIASALPVIPGISDIALELPEMPDFWYCLRHMYKKYR